MYNKLYNREHMIKITNNEEKKEGKRGSFVFFLKILQ